jgi:ABC-type nitrate/sulfonate/bicarbonate transport system substrate-binding protein
MKRRMVLSLLLCLALVMTAVLAGCGKGDSDKVKIRIGEVTRSLFYAPEYVAVAKGFFEEEGLDVELTTTPGGDKTMTALLSNAIDVALVGSETSIYVYQQGTDDPIINFAQLTQTVQSFTNAIHKAQLWVQNNDAEAITEVVLPYFENVDRDILKSSIDRYKQQGSFATDPIIDEAEWNNLLDVITTAGELEKRTEHSELVDTSFAEKAIEAVK